MQRRFEFYHIPPSVPEEKVAELEGVLRNVSRFIPQVKDSIVARPLGESVATMIWEHGYDSPESYEKYMQHPYHACMLDRYLMYGCPERITGRQEAFPGLAGYDIPDRGYFRAEGVRRVVILGMRDDAPEAEVAALVEKMRGTPAQAPMMTLSVAAENSMGNAWRRTPWSHLWEQTFDDEAAMQAYLDGDPPMAAVERGGWPEGPGGVVERSVAVHYRLHAPVA